MDIKNSYSQEEKEYFMREALKEAERSLAKDEIPIGCVIVKDGAIIGRGHNAREERNQAILHAEIMAIQEANRQEKNWRLLDTTLFVTIEPCVMCSGAIGLARIPQVIYGAPNQKFGAAGSLYDILQDERLNHRVAVETGVLEDECAKMMQAFFRQGREKKKALKQLQQFQEYTVDHDKLMKKA
ncbi:tRNA adenosine(34) deaminase TadA [Streptococcus marmotae]|uniref:tRNA adenosine(34) deaminase TadA n=1 Tax=Streptococcus marmotae TaxID=1825069 RepID=UPI00082C8E0E|nr:tRNA adenosine(34) deaminase TadA [Streptococcus marmotae]